MATGRRQYSSLEVAGLEVSRWYESNFKREEKALLGAINHDAAVTELE